MLIEFSVKNFRSIKEQQTFSMVAQSSKQRKNHLLKTGFRVAPELVGSASIYGPNASGKSNLVKAIEFLKDFVIDSSKNYQEGEEIEITPFTFSKTTPKQPSEFEIVFIHEDYLFQYGFTIDKKRVYKEWLYATPKSGEKQSPQKWYVRDEHNHTEKSFIKKELKGEKTLWRKSTRDNALFLSTAAQLGSKDFQIPFSWFQKKLYTLPSDTLLANFMTREKLQESKKSHEEIIQFMKSLDISFDDIQVENQEIGKKGLKDMPSELKKYIIYRGGSKLTSIYRLDSGEYTLDFNEESEGTKRLLKYAGPLLSILRKGGIWFVDELHRSLHPLALEGVLSMFQQAKYNKNNAQLIFTTHNTTAMRTMDKEQIWLMEKDKKAQSKLIPIADFKERGANEVIEKRYLTGRYGGLPNIGHVLDE